MDSISPGWVRGVSPSRLGPLLGLCFIVFLAFGSDESFLILYRLVAWFGRRATVPILRHFPPSSDFILVEASGKKVVLGPLDA